MQEPNENLKAPLPPLIFLTPQSLIEDMDSDISSITNSDEEKTENTHELSKESQGENFEGFVEINLDFLENTYFEDFLDLEKQETEIQPPLAYLQNLSEHSFIKNCTQLEQNHPYESDDDVFCCCIILKRK